MKQIDLGGQGLMASAVALGCMRIDTISPEALDKHIHTAVELGINFFDHADIYGGTRSESMFGQVLKDCPSLRENMLIQSKCGIRPGYYDFSKEHILASVDGSLQRLGISYLDVLLLHRPDTLMEPQEVAEAFSTLYNAGKVRYFGVSNFNSMQIELLQSALPHRIIANQMQLSIMHSPMIDFGIQTNTTLPGSVNRDGSLLEYCRLKHITIQAWSPFQHGFFGGVFLDNDQFPEVNAVLDRIANQQNVTKPAVAIAWILRHPANMQAIVGTTNTKRLMDICQADKVNLSREEWYEIYRAAGNRVP